MLKATYIFSTKYLVDDYKEDLQFLVACVLGNRSYREDMYDQNLCKAIQTFEEEGIVDIDFAGARFSSNFWRYMVAAIIHAKGRFVIHDTRDKDRNEFFQELIRIAEEEEPDTKPLPPRPKTINDLGTWVNNLDPETIYNVTSINDCPEFLTIIQLMRPEIRIKASYAPWFKYIQNAFSEVLNNESTDFWYITNATNDTIWHTECDASGKVHITNLGDMPKKEFINKYTVIPREIGTVRYNPATASPAWQRAVKDVTNDVVKYLAKKPRTMLTYWEV